MASTNRATENIQSENKQASAYTDPTYNVLQLVSAAVLRLDDLQKANEKLANSELRRVDEVAKLHVMYAEKLTQAESKRIDAIRAVDVGAVAIASERTAQQAVVLANQVSTSAETLRQLVATTSNTVAQQFQQVTSALLERIAMLEKSSYEEKGKQTLSDPRMVELLNEIKDLKESAQISKGSGIGMRELFAWIGAAVAIIFTIYKSL